MSPILPAVVSINAVRCNALCSSAGKPARAAWCLLHWVASLNLANVGKPPFLVYTRHKIVFLAELTVLPAGQEAIPPLYLALVGVQL